MSILTIKNKKTGVEYPVSAAEWQQMKDVKRDKFFTLIGEQATKAVQAVPTFKKPTVPPEVKELQDSKSGGDTTEKK